jgi:hypothetical protein
MKEGAGSSRRMTIRTLDEEWEVSHRVVGCLGFIYKWLIFI